jgi:hypothetical protein
MLVVQEQRKLEVDVIPHAFASRDKGAVQEDRRLWLADRLSHHSGMTSARGRAMGRAVPADDWTK